MLLQKLKNESENLHFENQNCWKTQWRNGKARPYLLATTVWLLQVTDQIVVAVVLNKFGGIQDGCADVLVAKLTEAH